MASLGLELGSLPIESQPGPLAIKGLNRFATQRVHLRSLPGEQQEAARLDLQSRNAVGEQLWLRTGHSIPRKVGQQLAQ
jgi:hypothetical protein